MLSSAVIAAIITALVNGFIIPNINYRNEFYKKIVEKRIDAYESISSFLNHFILTYTNSQTENQYFHCFHDKEHFKQMQDSLKVVANKYFWLENRTLIAFKDISELCIKMAKEVQLTQKYPNDFQNIFFINKDEISQLKVHLEICMLEDFEKISNIKEFWKLKKKKSPKILQDYNEHLLS